MIARQNDKIIRNNLSVFILDQFISRYCISAELIEYSFYFDCKPSIAFDLITGRGDGLTHSLETGIILYLKNC